MTTITLPRAVVEQALKALEGAAECVQQNYLPDKCGHDWDEQIIALRAALAQQDEPVQVAERERIASQWDGCVTHQLDTFGPVNIGASIRAGELVEAQQAEPDLSRCPQCNGPADNGFDRSFPPSPYLCTKCMAKPAQDPTVWVASKDGRVIYDDASTDDGLLRVSGDFENDEQRISYAKQIVDKLNAAPPQQAEPLNLSDPAVQKRLAAQWGYVPAAAQAEPVEPVAWHYRNNGGASVMHWGPSAKLDADMQVAKEYPNAHKVTPLYTAPPRRTMVPLTEEEIVEAVREADLDWQAGWTLDEHAPNRFDALARAVEKASWEKNHGQA